MPKRLYTLKEEEYNSLLRWWAECVVYKVVRNILTYAKPLAVIWTDRAWWVRIIPMMETFDFHEPLRSRAFALCISI